MPFKGCKHNNKCAFYLSNGDFICYNYIYKYNLTQDLCIPINNNDFNNYTDLCKDYFNKMRNRIKNIFNKILNEIDELELDKIDNINSILNKIDIKFKLPIEVPFEDRLKIGIKKDLSKKIYNNLNLNFLDSYLNIYNTELDKFI